MGKKKNKPMLDDYNMAAKTDNRRREWLQVWCGNCGHRGNTRRDEYTCLECNYTEDTLYANGRHRFYSYNDYVPDQGELNTWHRLGTAPPWELVEREPARMVQDSILLDVSGDPALIPAWSNLPPNSYTAGPPSSWAPPPQPTDFSDWGVDDE
jgi:hypothetical protein